ncbi:MAG: rod shape-determining protein MreC [Candidatus Kapabacteria bacterium]|nr:rod shape-determining protein MreC [Ignavibacteriota bacterium]MCW5885441.1 rod shape-determining protein MreC [Candidatus Kapabacteria bacterium]
MQNFINFVTRYKEYIAFTSLVIICLALISIGDVSKIGGFRTIIIGSTAWIQGAFSWIPNPGSLQNENRSLRELNLQLSTEVIKMRTSAIENNRLRQLIDFKEKYPDTLISAEIVGKSSIELRNYNVINKGKSSGLERGMSLRTDAGLVGYIIGSSDNYSLVEMLNNRNVKVSAKILRTGIDGIITWSGGEYFNLNNIPTSFDIQKGDVVLTSEFSNKYPSDIPFGEVIDVIDENNSLFFTIKIKPYVNLSTVEQVFVIKKIPDEERNDLLKELEDRLKIKKQK